MMMKAVMVLMALMVVLVMVMVVENCVGFDDNDDDENPKVNHWRDGRMPAYRPTLERQLLQPF